MVREIFSPKHSSEPISDKIWITLTDVTFNIMVKIGANSPIWREKNAINGRAMCSHLPRWYFMLSLLFPLLFPVFILLQRSASVNVTHFGLISYSQKSQETETKYTHIIVMLFPWLILGWYAHRSSGSELAATALSTQNQTHWSPLL